MAWNAQTRRKTYWIRKTKPNQTDLTKTERNGKKKEWKKGRKKKNENVSENENEKKKKLTPIFPNTAFDRGAILSSMV